MKVRFIRATDREHLLEVARRDGSVERATCETRSFLVHDLLHLAVESEAMTQAGVWGLLARGMSLTELNDRTRPPDRAAAELMEIEKVVGYCTSLTKGRSPAEVMAGVRQLRDTGGYAPPAWLDEAFLERVKERMRKLLGHWKATKHGEAMEVDWG